MTRLLVVTTVPNTLAAFLLPYAAHFRRMGWTVDAATGGNVMPESVINGFDCVHHIDWSRHPIRSDNLKAVAQAQAVLRAEHYDVVHTHTPVASFVIRAAVSRLRPARRPFVVYTAHGFHFHPRGSVAGNWLYRAAEKKAGRHTDRLVVINNVDYEAARRHSLVPANALVQMPGIGLDLERYRPTAQLRRAANDARASLRLQAHEPLFTMMAELNDNKNHGAVLRALAVHERKDQHLLLLGAGPLRDRLAAEAERLGIGARVHFLGRVDDVRPWILASRATILVSYREGLSRAVLESLAMGVPVIGARTRGIAEVIGSDGGIIVEPDDFAAIARAFDATGHFPGPAQLRDLLAPRLGRYSLDRLLREHERLYSDLCGERSEANTGTARL